MKGVTEEADPVVGGVYRADLYFLCDHGSFYGIHGKVPDVSTKTRFGGRCGSSELGVRRESRGHESRYPRRLPEFDGGLRKPRLICVSPRDG